MRSNLLPMIKICFGGLLAAPFVEGLTPEFGTGHGLVVLSASVLSGESASHSSYALPPTHTLTL